MTVKAKPRIFTASPSSMDMIDGDFITGDLIILGNQIQTYMGSGVWLTSHNDVVLPGTVYYVDSVKGSNTNSGLSWTMALLTIAAALAVAVAGDKILVKGSFSEADSIAANQTGLSIIGAGTGPNQAIWTSLTDTVSLIIGATDIVIANIKFKPPTYTTGTPASIQLGSASYTHFVGCRFQGQAGSYRAVYSPICLSDSVTFDSCEFIYLNNITTVYGTAVEGVVAGGLNYSGWKFRNCEFNSCIAGIKLPAKTALIDGGHFRVNGLKADGTMGAVTGSAGSKKMIDFSGTNSYGNCVHGAYLGGAYSSTLYAVGASDDDWSGNFNIAGLTAANPG
jgi:hypothetical protein